MIEKKKLMLIATILVALTLALAGCATETGPGSSGSDIDGKADTFGESPYGNCTIDSGEEGVCIDRMECDNAGGTRYPGYCPGGSNIQCCIPPEGESSPCSAGGGVCIPQEEYTTCAQDYDLGWVESDLACGGVVDQLCCVPRSNPCSAAGGVCIPQEEYTTCAQDYDLGWVESDHDCGGILDELCCVPREEEDWIGGIEEVHVYGLDPYIHPEFGFWFVYRPGVYPSLHHFGTIGELYAWLESVNPTMLDWVSRSLNSTCNSLQHADPGFSCDNEEDDTYPFAASGCFYDTFVDQHYLDLLMTQLEEYDVRDFTEEEEWLGGEITDSITHQVTVTSFDVSFSYSVVDSDTFLMVIDFDAFSCDA